MALKVFDGFDHYNGQTDLLARQGFLQFQSYPPGSGGSLPTITFGPGVSVDGECMIMTGGSGGYHAPLTAVWGTRNSQFIVGGRFECLQYQVGAQICSLAFIFWDSTTVPVTAQFAVVFNSNSYTIEIWNGSLFYNGVSTKLYSTANNVWSGDVANMIEIQTTIAAGGAGVVKVWVNGVQLVNQTAITTQQSANAWADATSFKGDFLNGGALLSTLVKMDDLYYCDTTVGAGTYPCNSPLGDVHVYTRFPTGNNSVQWTPLANTNWQEVDEVAMDGDTSYNYSATVGQEDLLNYSALATTINNILGVQVTGAYRKDDSSARSIKQAFKSSTTEVYGAVNSLGTAYAYYTDLWVLDPATSASWTLAAVNALSAGYNLVS
jgi:hypothetical protein